MVKLAAALKIAQKMLSELLYNVVAPALAHGRLLSVDCGCVVELRR
jgi:hypothetical protein